LEIKERIRMNKKNILPIVLGLALIITAYWGYDQYREKRRYHTHLVNDFQRRYYDLLGSVQTINTDLSKLLVSTGSKENMILYSNIWRNAYNAQEEISQFPIKHGELQKTEKFLSQLGDYTFAMAQKSIDDEDLSKKDRENLEKLRGYASTLSVSLNELRDQTFSGKVIKLRLKDKPIEKKENPMQNKFIQFEERMVEYPELIYDGPFSDHVAAGISPRLEGKKISFEDAKEVAKKYFGNVNIKGDSKEPGGKLNTYSITAYKNEKNPIYIDITQTKGYFSTILNNRTVGKPTLSKKQGIKKANEFLEKIGFKNMISTYTLTYNNALLINYVYKEGDVVMYPDLVKVKVALDNGEVVGLDATKHLTSNYKRQLKAPIISLQEAKERMGNRGELEGEGRLCVIPTKSLKEIFCYEFKVTYKDETFLIYINAHTGREERILKLIKQENGTLTM
jgi:germination protein YpeB